ncbi:MAG TPA: wax ester/triacylglycerol synthase family O-acyltransferase [Jatrophihabitantaceae bacterium]
MLLPMSPADSLFLMVETREHPMHVGGLQLFVPPEGADANDVRQIFQQMISVEDIRPLFRRRARRSVTSLGMWGWEEDVDFDIEHHVRHTALPRPGRVLELLALCSRLHSNLLDRHRPLWEASLIEGLADGRFAMYLKMHHAVVDGVSALRLLQSGLSEDPDRRDMPPPWARLADGERPPRAARDQTQVLNDALHSAMNILGEAAGLPSALVKTVNRGIHEQTAPLSFSAPKTMLNVPITGARRFAAQSWPMERIRRVGKAAEATVNDVVLAMCSGALRSYMLGLDALPESPLIAMVPVSLHVDDNHREGGNAIGVVMCNLGTHLADPAARLAAINASMTDGKEAMAGMSAVQIMAMSALGMSPLAIAPLLGVQNMLRPPFNLVISNVPGPRSPLYYNGARLDGLYPLSIPVDGQALNITCTSYSDELAFGLTGCRRSVPHLQRLLGHLDDELNALEIAAGVA